jgi:abequosyltransferase
MSQESSQRRAGQPRISLTIPTWNRAPFLAELLESVMPQRGDAEDVELLISDNGSTDETAAVVRGFEARGLRCRYVRNATNVGADGNFLQCLNLARGQYVWVMGDDDVLLPGALPALLSLLGQKDVDMVYLSSVAFTGKLEAGEAETRDKLGRCAEVVTDGAYFLEKVNALLGLISVMIVNKNRLMAAEPPAIEALQDTNLMQVGWLFPLVHRRMAVLYVWERLVAYRSFNSGGWGICEVFGVRLERIARGYFSAEPELTDALMNGVLRYWMCDAIVGMRSGHHAAMNKENFAADVRHVFAGNWRYWVFVWPVAELPLPLAKALHAVLKVWNKLTRVAQGICRHWFGHGEYLRSKV